MTSPNLSSRTRTLVVVLAGGVGGRLGVLTERRAKPAVPVAGMFRLIDVALSNVAHSRLDDVWVIEQYEPHDLNDHLANGRPWDLDRTHGGLQILPPFQRRDGDEAMAQGNADALVQQRHLLAAFAPDVVITMSADHLCRIDLRDVLDTHHRHEAALTVVTTDVPAGDDPSRFAWVAVDDDGLVTAFEYKPEHPTGDRICTEIFAYDWPTLRDRLDGLPDDGSAGDYGDVLVPDLVDETCVVEHRLHGYWRDIGTIDAYHRAHMELLADQPPLELHDQSWPFLTGSIVGGPAHVTATATVRGCLLSPGTAVAGTATRSVLGRNVVVEEAATVGDSVVLDDAVIRSGAVVENAIVDVGTVVSAGDAGSLDDASGVVIFAAGG